MKQNVSGSKESMHTHPKDNLKSIIRTPALPTLSHPPSCAFSILHDNQQCAEADFPEGWVTFA